MAKLIITEKPNKNGAEIMLEGSEKDLIKMLIGSMAAYEDLERIMKLACAIHTDMKKDGINMVKDIEKYFEEEAEAEYKKRHNG